MTDARIKIALDANEARAAANNLTDAFKSMNEAMREAEKAGGFKAMSDIASGMKDIRTVSGGIADKGSTIINQQTGLNPATIGLLAQQAAHFAIQSMSQGVDLWVNSYNRSGVVSRAGSGDPYGASIEMQRKRAEESEGLGGIFGTIGGSIIGGALGTLIAPGVGTVAGASILGQAGNFIGRLPGKKMEAEANRMETMDAFAKLWKEQAKPAMALNAMMTDVSGSMEENTINIRDSFNRAADAANKFGNSAEEGMEVIQEMARHGLGDNSYQSAEKIFKYELATGADRGTLSQAEGRFSRFKAGDALGAGYAGTFASGMEKGQYNEFLRGMQQVFEDGIQKGFIKGAREIAGDMTFLSKLSGGSEFWKGEMGANKMLQMGSGISNATNLSGVTDILSFRAANSLADSMGMDKLNAMSEQDAIYDAKYGYVNAMRLLERGFRPELVGGQLEAFETAEGKENHTGIIERIRQAYGFNYESAAQLYQMYEKNGSGYFSSEAGQKALKDFKGDPGNYASIEMQMLKNVEEIKTFITTNMGMKAFEDKLDKLPDILNDIRLV